MNEVYVSGNLVADPTVQVVGEYKVCRVGIVVNDKGKKKTSSLFNVDIWNKAAELVGQFYVKGQLLSIRGSLKQESYEKDGKKVSVVKIISNEILNLPNRTEKQSEPTTVVADVGVEEYPF